MRPDGVFLTGRPSHTGSGRALPVRLPRILLNDPNLRLRLQPTVLCMGMWKRSTAAERRATTACCFQFNGALHTALLLTRTIHGQLHHYSRFGAQSANGGLNSSQGGSGNLGYINPDNRNFDKGNCASSLADRRHVFNLSGVAESPKFSSAVLPAVAPEWRFSPILRILSGVWQSATVSDIAFSAIANQRANQILPNMYGEKTQDNWLNPAAFARPAPGALGNVSPNTILGPGQFQFDASLTRTFQIRENQSVEFRAEAFNVTNSPRLGNPTTKVNSSQFGRTASKNGSRIMQFALKYFF